jgi:hypothetical protein
MISFEIQSIQEEDYSFIIFSTNCSNPLDDLDEIEKILKNKLNGKVIFDMLLSNGNTSNRFIEADFNGSTFNIKSFKIPAFIDNKIKEISSLYYKDKVEFINSDKLSNAFKFLLEKGKI